MCVLDVFSKILPGGQILTGLKLAIQPHSWEDWSPASLSPFNLTFFAMLPSLQQSKIFSTCGNQTNRQTNSRRKNVERKRADTC